MRSRRPRPTAAALVAVAALTLASVPLPAQENDGETAEAPAAKPPEGGAAEIPEAPEETGRFSALLDELSVKWKLGGPTMYVIAFVALIAVLYTLDRALALRRSKIAPRHLTDRANALWQKGDYDGVVALARKSGSSLGRTIAFIVEHRDNAYAEINSAAEDIAGRDFERHARRNYPLLAVGTIAPLLGLMGTVFGLMGAFASIGVYGSMDNPAVLAKDIGEAMVTTATGLIVAVPALGFYHYFRNRTGELASVLGEDVSNLMHTWFLKRKA